MKPIERAFLSSILESPDDDAPRLICADWLEENGQEERAEFIRVQCELAKIDAIEHDCGEDGEWKTTCPACGASSAGEELSRRERELLNGICGLGVEALPIVEGLTRSNLVGRGGYGWYPRNEPDVGIESVFRRGFVEEVTLPLTDWLRHGPALVQVAPLRVVRLSDYQPMFNASWGWAYVPGRSELGAGNWWRGFRDVLLKTFSTEPDALAAMSRCCLLYACVQTVPVR